MNPADINLSELDIIGLTTLRTLVNAEIDRRNTIVNAQSTINAINQASLISSGITPGSPWRKPTGAVDAYPLGFEVTYGGDSWVNLTNGNPYTPGQSGWRIKPKEGEVGRYVQPSGAHDAYGVGEEVLFENEIYRSIRAANVWSPSDSPSGWEKIRDVKPVDPGPTDPVDPGDGGGGGNNGGGDTGTNPGGETKPAADYKKPTGQFDSYKKGDRVKFEGAVYESKIDNNIWTPTEYPAGWTKVQ